MAAALISRTPQRLISIIEGIHEDRSSSRTISELSRDDSKTRGVVKRGERAISGRLKQILDIPTFGREDEIMGRADSPNLKNDTGQGVKSYQGNLPESPGATDLVVDRYAAALALNEIAKAKAKIPQVLLRRPIVVGKSADAEYPTLCAALKTLGRGNEAVIYLTDAVYREQAPLSIFANVRLQPDPGSQAVPRIHLTGGVVGVQLVESSAVLHVIGVTFEHSAPVRVSAKPIQVVAKALVHPPVGGHSAEVPGFGEQSAMHARCFQVERGSLRLERCSVRSVAGDGVVIGARGRLELDGGEIKGCGRHGLSATDGAHATLRSVGLQSNVGCGFVAYGASTDVDLSACEVRQNGWSGGAVDGGAGVRVKGGSLSGNGHAGLHVQGAGSTAHVAAWVRHREAFPPTPRVSEAVAEENAASDCVVTWRRGGSVIGQNKKHGVSVDCCAEKRKGGALGRGDAYPLLQMNGQAQAIGRGVRGQQGGARAWVCDSQLKGNGACGVRVKGMLGQCDVRDCRVEESAMDGLAARAGGVVVGNGCQLTRNRGAGVRAEGRGAVVELSHCKVVDGDYGVVAQDGEVKLHRCRVAMNLRADREELGAGRVEDVLVGEGDEQWVAHAGGRPPTMFEPPQWLADMPKTNALRTWHGF